MPENTLRPMLAEDASVEYYEKLLKQVPLYVSTKLDGVRARVVDGKLISRKAKLIPNTFVQDILALPLHEGLDGELIVGSPFGEGVFNRTQSGVMSQAGRPDFTYYVFDWTIEGVKGLPFEGRLNMLLSSRGKFCPRVIILPQRRVTDIAQLLELEANALDAGYEGLIVRRGDAPYKHGRSTLVQGYLLKLKRFMDSEAKIVGFVEEMRNNNEAIVDPQGLSKRSSHKANKIGKGRLGAWVVQDIHHPEWEFNIGSGFDAAQRQQYWDDREQMLGKVVAYKYLPAGMKDLPRHPVFKGLRHLDDIG